MAHEIRTVAYSGHVADNPNTFTYSGSFDVFKGIEVKVTLDNVALTHTTSTINESASPREYTVDTTAKTIHIGGANLSSGTVQIKPETDLGQLPGSTAPQAKADYTPGASITSVDLNNNQLQLMRRALEYDEQKLDTAGGTMTGNLHMDINADISFEGDTDNAYETTLTVTDPTADRTITLPNVSGTVVTTGDTATVTATMLAANSVDSSELVDGSIDTSHIANLQVTTDKLAADAVTGAKIADDAINSEHYTDGSIDTAHIAAAQVTTAKLADDAVTTAKITDGNVTTAKIAADAITAAKIADDVINSEHYAADSIDTEHYASGSVDATALASNAVTTVKINADAVTGAKIADDSIDSEHFVDGSIDTAHIADSQITSAKINDGTIVNADVSGSAAIAHSKLANVTDGHVLVGNGSNVPTAVAIAGDVSLTNTGAVTIQNDAIEIGMIGCEQTTISDSDSHIPTSGAVVDYVAAQLAPIGGLEVIADDESFPNTIPSAGVVISITDAAGLQVNSSGVSTNGDALDNSTITINGFPSELRGGVGSNADPYVFQSGAGLMVQSTGSSQTYNYHQAMIRESDFVQLSDDINDFNNRYRIHAGEPSSNNDDGDLVWDTNADSMKVYDGTASAWKEVTSSGDFKFLVAVDAGTTTAATFDDNDTSFDLKETTNSGSAASVSNINQLSVSLNGVIQKPNTGSYSASEEGFYLTDTDTIRFCTAPPTGSSCFIIQSGSAVSIPTPGDGTVTAAKIANGAVVAAGIGTSAVETAKINADAVTGAKIADDAVGAEHIEVLDAALQFGDNVKAQFGTGNDFEIFYNGTNTVLAQTSNSGALLLQGAPSESSIRCNASGSVDLYYDNAKKFETTSTGVNIPANNLTIDADNGEKISLKGTAQPYIRWYESSTAKAYVQWLSAGYLQIQNDETSKGLRIGGSGAEVLDGVKFTCGDDQDLQIYHNGTDGYITNGTGTLNIRTGGTLWIDNAGGTETYIKAVENGAVELNYDNAKKLETYTEGIRVTGYVKALHGTDSHWGTTNDHNWHQFMNDDAGNVAIFENTHDTTPYGNYIYFSDAAPDNNTSYFLWCDDSSAARFKIFSDGDVWNHDNSYTGSDQTLKENIVDATPKLEDLKKLKVRNFNWKSEYFPEKSKKKQLGFIAQEVEQVFPALVTEHDIAPGTPGDDHTPVMKKAIKQAWDPIIIKAMQELIEKVETLETKVAALEAG